MDQLSDQAWSKEGAVVYDYPLTGTMYDEDDYYEDDYDEEEEWDDEDLPSVNMLEVWLDHRSPFEVMAWGAVVGLIAYALIMVAFA